MTGRYQHVIDAFGERGFAKQCGFGMVTIHGGHGWLIHSSGQNRSTRERTSGAVTREPHAAPLAIVESVRAVGKDFPVEFH